MIKKKKQLKKEHPPASKKKVTKKPKLKIKKVKKIKPEKSIKKLVTKKVKKKKAIDKSNDIFFILRRNSREFIYFFDKLKEYRNSFRRIEIILQCPEKRDFERTDIYL